MTKKKIKPTSTAIIPVDEASNFRKSGDFLVLQSRQFDLKTSGDENKAYDVLRNIADTKKAIEKRRTDITKPLNASLKAANAMFKELAAPFLEADGILRAKITRFHDIKEAQAEKMRERRLEKAAEAEEAGDEETALVYEQKADEVEAKVGKSTVTKRWTFEVVDMAKVPREYLEINSGTVRQAIKDEVREIPGLRIYQEAGVSVR